MTKHKMILVDRVGAIEELCGRWRALANGKGEPDILTIQQAAAKFLCELEESLWRCERTPEESLHESDSADVKAVVAALQQFKADSEERRRNAREKSRKELKALLHGEEDE